MQEATLCFPLRGTPVREILLGYKKRGFAAGKYGGFGGKIEPHESPLEAALRELEEETGIRAASEDTAAMGRLTFYFPYKPEWSQIVHLFTLWRWQGECKESEEMAPAWFPVEKIPYGAMWHDCLFWLPLTIQGRPVVAEFVFSADNEKVEQSHISEMESYP